MGIFAVHISDGVLSPLFLGVGFAAALLLLLPAIWRVSEDEVPRIGLLTAAFFVASSIHVKVPPTSVHLVLNALVGVILGRRAPLAIGVGLFLQAALLSHGGFTTLGVNAVVISLPALGAGILLPNLIRRFPSRRRAFWIGSLTGFATVVLTAALNAFALIIGGVVDWTFVAAPQFTVYVVLGVVEGLILGVTAEFLLRVQPQLLGIQIGATRPAAKVLGSPVAASPLDGVTSSQSRTDS